MWQLQSYVSPNPFIIWNMVNYKQLIELDGYINIWEVIPEDEHSHISNKIWEALDRAGITLSQDAELSVRVYDSIESGT